MKTILFSATILMGLTAPVWATGLNSIAIDASSNGGGVTTLSITQDATNLSNQVSGTSGSVSNFPIAGHWDTVSIDQEGGANTLVGSVQAHSGSTTASLTAAYAGGNNTHSLTIGNTAAPTDPTVAIAVTNTASTANTITDTLNGSSLNYNLYVNGTGNSVTNAVSASGAVALNQGPHAVSGYGITGDNNTVSNTVSGVASFTHTLTITGSSNTVTNSANTGGNKTITQSITGANNTVAMALTGTGTQAAGLSVDTGTTVNYSLATAANNSNVTMNLNNVVGDLGVPAVVTINQSSAADGAVVNLTISGGIYTMGNSLAGGTAGVVISQNTAGASVTGTMAAAANGYTVHFTQ